MAEKKKMRKRLTKNEFFERFSEKTDLPKKDVKTFFEVLVSMAKHELERSGEMTIPDIGKIVCKDRKARMGRNPATGESIKIPAKTVLKFRITKSFRVAVLGEPPKTTRASSKDKKKKKRH